MFDNKTASVLGRAVVASVAGLALGPLLAAGVAVAAPTAATAEPPSQFVGDYPTFDECKRAAALVMAANSGAYSDWNCVKNGGGPSDGSSYSAYVKPWIHS